MTPSSRWTTSNGPPTISSREHSLGDALVYLHKMPGPHNVDVRGNSPLMRWWRVLADATAYLTLFITVSGIYLWVALKAERRVGLVLGPCRRNHVLGARVCHRCVRMNWRCERRRRGAFDSFLVWNRRVHFYLGLYLLFFIWLFAFTGLLLNHPRWQFAQFWPNRIQSTTEHTLESVTAVADIDRAREVMRQLGIAGEVQWPATQPRERTVHVPSQSTWVGRRCEG